jgi:putative endonuclease
MPDRRQRYGEAGETLAARVLRRQGYRILETNYRTPIGEIDLIARERDTIVFVEVKARRSPHFGHPKAAVTALKQRKLSMVALYYLKTTGQSGAKARFDVVAICGATERSEVEVVRNAFELAYG